MRHGIAWPVGLTTVALACVLVWPGELAGQDLTPQTSAFPIVYRALAVRTVEPVAAVPVEIVIQRWSTDDEDDRMLAAAVEGGPDQLRAVVEDLPEVGRLRTTGTVGIPLAYARLERVLGVGERVNILTARPMGFLETATLSRSTEYALTLVQMLLKPNGDGEGTLMGAARITVDRRTRTLLAENFEIAPIRLQAIKRQ